jgi:SLT domain-containing protein
MGFFILQKIIGSDDMAKQISTVLNLVNHWSNPMQACVRSTLGFTQVTKNATAITKALDKDGSRAVRNYANEVEHLHNRVRTAGSGISTSFKNMARSAITFGLGLASGLNLKSMIANATAAQKATAQMSTVLKSTGGAAGLTKKQLLDLAAAQSKVTTYSKGANIATENLLLTFTNIKGSVFKQALVAVNDMSTALGQSTKASAIQLGKALNDPIKGVTALGRVGVNFTSGQKNMIKSLAQTGQTAKAQQIILSEVSKEFGGSAAAAAKTIPGQTAIIKNTFTGLGASIATTVIPYLYKFTTWLGEEIPKGTTIVQKYLPGISKVITNIVKQAGPVITGIAKDVGGIVLQLIPKFGGSTQNLGKTITALVTGPLYGLRDVLDYLKNHMGLTRVALTGFITAIGTIKITKTITDMGQFIKSFRDAKKAIDDARKATGNLSIVQKVGGGFSKIGSSIRASLPTFTDLRIAASYAGNAVKKVGVNIGAGFSKGISSVRTLGSNLLGVGKNALIAAKNVALMGLGIAKQGAIFIINAARMAIFKGATLGIAAAQKIAAGAQRLLNLAMNANPIIKVISVIIALGSALVVLYQKNVWFRNKVNAVFASFKTLPAKFRGWAHDMINGFVKGIEEKFAPIKKAAKGIADIVKKFLHFSKPDEGPLQQYGQWMPDMITGMSTGMTAASPILWRSTNNMTAGMANTVQAYVNTGRPSGANSVNGIASGVNAASPNAWKSTSNMTAGMSGRLMIFTNSCNPVGISAVNELAKGIANSGAQSNILSVVKTLTDKVINAFRNGFGIASPSKVFFKIGNYIVQGFINGLTNKDMGKFIKKWIGSITGSVSGDLSGWLTAAMAITGTPMSYLPALESIAMHESGGNPKAINLWDINAIEGHPSKGLMQMIDSSFSRYAIPGLGDIWNPVANAAASIRYMIGTYGSIANVPGIRSMMHGGGYVGYIDGTDNAKRGFAALSENGEPELVVGKQYRYFEGGEQVVNSKRLKSLFNKSGESKFTVNLNIQGNVIGNEQYAKEMGEYLGNTVISAIENM